MARAEVPRGSPDAALFNRPVGPRAGLCVRKLFRKGRESTSQQAAVAGEAWNAASWILRALVP